MKKLLVTALGLALAGAAFAFYTMGDDDEANGSRTVAVEKGTLVEKALAIGEIVPRHEIAIKSKVSGTVAQVFVEEGTYVEAGAPLIEVKPSPTPLEYAQAKRTAEMRLLTEGQRHADLRRVRGLLEHGMASQADSDRAQEQYGQAVLQRQMAEEQLAILDRGRAVVAGRTVENIITNPIAGSVLDISVDVGDPIVPLTSYQPGTELMSMADMAELLFEGTVDEIDVGKISEGMPVEVKVGAFPNQIVVGTLARISLKSKKRDNATVFAVEIDDLTVPEAVTLRAGYSANADIIIRRVEDVLVLPERVLEFRNDSTFVRLPSASPDVDPEERFVEVGMSDGIQIEVAAGLELGDDVLEKATREIE